MKVMSQLSESVIMAGLVAADVPTISKGISGQTGHLQEWQVAGNANNPLAYISNTGQVVGSALQNVRTAANQSPLLLTSPASATAPTVDLIAGASQTGAMTRWLASNGSTQLAKVDTGGIFYTGAMPLFANAVSGTIFKMSYLVVTVSMTSGAGNATATMPGLTSINFVCCSGANITANTAGPAMVKTTSGAGVQVYISNVASYTGTASVAVLAIGN